MLARRFTNILFAAETARNRSELNAAQSCGPNRVLPKLLTLLALPDFSLFELSQPGGLQRLVAGTQSAC
jgi:hypothetical protein